MVGAISHPVEKTSSILVVDDDEANRESLRRRLERRGYHVSVAVDGTDALRQVSQGAFDLLILDVMMPGINGLDVLDTLRKTYSPTQLPIIMATARDQSEDVVTALGRGANDYVTKPLDFAVVSARVQTHMQLKQSVDQIVALEANLEMRNRELNAANARLTETAERTARELSAAAKVQKTFLPEADPRVAGARFSWVFQPCTELAGDSLNVVQLDERSVALYVLDVSGHGVAASLLAVTVTRWLSASASGDSLVLESQPDGTKRVLEPREVATRLSQNFSIDVTDQFTTLFYAVYNTETREFKYISAGHPGAIRIAQGAAPMVLDGTGMPIGIGEKYDQQSVRLNPGDRVFLYTDGVIEAMDSRKDHFGIERLTLSLRDSVSEPLAESISRLKTEVDQWQGAAGLRDDITILGMECA
jgi:sigma-B regulation protein RsbU (phosphoserine phosphatase)